MKKFIKENKWITRLFILSIFTIILYMLTLDFPEWFPHTGDWFNLVFQIAIGFIINFIFYVTQVYIPQLKLKESVNKSICTEIDRIIERSEELISHLDTNKVIERPWYESTNEQLLALLQGLNTNGTVFVLNPRKSYNTDNLSNSYFTVKEWIISRVEFIEHLSDNIRKYYPQYITPELTSVLDDIVYSPLHQSMCRVHLQIPILTSYADCPNDIFFSTYRDLMKRLIVCKKEYE